MGTLFGKPKKPISRVTDQDRAILQLKQQRDRLKQYQKRIELSLENDRQLAKKCLNTGRKDRAKLLLRKRKYQETLLTNTDQQLENLEKMVADIEFAQVEINVIAGLKVGNEALKKMHNVMDINEVEKILDETREGVEKQDEINALLLDVLTPEDEDDVIAELDALEAESIEKQSIALPDVPTDELPEQKIPKKLVSKDQVKTEKVMVEL